MNSTTETHEELEGQRVRIWAGRRSDGREPFEAVIRWYDSMVGLVLVGDSVPAKVTHVNSPYARVMLMLADGDYLVPLVQLRKVELVEPPPPPRVPKPLEPPTPMEPLQPVVLTEPPTLPGYVRWQPSGRDGAGFWRLLVWCPECRTVHLHGGGGDDRDKPPSRTGNHRVAHCTHKDSAYRNVGYRMDLEPIPEQCERGHSYEPDTIAITADGLGCLKCDPKLPKPEMTFLALRPVPDLTDEQLRRFESNLEKDPETGHWYRKGTSRNVSRTRRGGKVGLNGLFYPAHRVALKIAGKPEPHGYRAEVTCGDKSCINPNHRRFTQSMMWRDVRRG